MRKKSKSTLKFKKINNGNNQAVNKVNKDESI